MQRDLELVRIILMAVEANPDPQEWIDPEPEGYTADQISYHIMLLDQAGLIEGWNRSAIGVFRWSARNLTWRGQETLAAMKNDTAWAKSKVKLNEIAPGIVFELLVEELLAELRRTLAHSG